MDKINFDIYNIVAPTAIGNGWTVDVISHIFKGLVE